MNQEEEIPEIGPETCCDTPDDSVNPGREMLRYAEAAAEFLKTIANPNRLVILCALAGNRREMSVSELESVLDLRQPTLSQQLARLREDNMVATRRDGKSIYYHLNSNRAGVIVMLLYEWYCANGRSG